jgi:hypothetical protein
VILRGLSAALFGILLALGPGACAPDRPPTVPEIEAGIDRLMRLGFDAPAADADAFATRLVPDGLAPGLDRGLLILGTGLPGWPAAWPKGSAGGETLIPGRRSRKVVVAPAGPGRRRVWVAVFTL